jgi:hypothetical protein
MGYTFRRALERVAPMEETPRFFSLEANDGFTLKELCADYY